MRANGWRHDKGRMPHIIASTSNLSRCQPWRCYSVVCPQYTIRLMDGYGIDGLRPNVYCALPNDTVKPIRNTKHVIRSGSFAALDPHILRHVQVAQPDGLARAELHGLLALARKLAALLQVRDLLLHRLRQLDLALAQQP